MREDSYDSFQFMSKENLIFVFKFVSKLDCICGNKIRNLQNQLDSDGFFRFKFSFNTEAACDIVIL